MHRKIRRKIEKGRIVVIKWLRKGYKAIIAIIIVGLCLVPFIWNDWFFETHTTIAEKVTYVGAFIASILLATNAYLFYKRNNLMAKGQLDTRFKDAAILLAAGNMSSELSGIHALHQIAVEASQTKDQKNYVSVIKNILITFIKEKSVIEYKKDEAGKMLLDKVKAPIVDKAHNNKSQIVLQIIIDKLFKDENCEIYTEYPTDLSSTVLKEINFSNAKLQGANFDKALLQNANFSLAQLQNARFENAQLQNVRFASAQLQGAHFWNAQLQEASFGLRPQLRDANFTHAQLQNTNFFNAELKNASFAYAQLQNTNFTNAELQGVSFYSSVDIDKAFFDTPDWNEYTDFTKTVFENKTMDELAEIMGYPARAVL